MSVPAPERVIVDAGHKALSVDSGMPAPWQLAGATYHRPSDEHGILDLADLERLVPDLDERTTFACGPGGLLDALAAHHEERGLPLYVEQFRVSTVVAGEGGTVTFDQAGVEVECDGARPILEQAEDGTVIEAFRPDFYLPDQDLYVEVTVMKQSLVTRKNRKLRKLREQYPGVQIKLFYKRDIERLAQRYQLDLAS